MDESSGMTASGDDILSSYHLPRPLPLWLSPAYAKHIVKGNFMTLSAGPRPSSRASGLLIKVRPSLPDHAHVLHPASVLTLLTLGPAVVEHYRNLWNFVRVVHEKEDDGNSICNPTKCSRMSAGA